MPSTSPGAGPWHEALVLALTGAQHPELGIQLAPDLIEVERWLRSDGRVDQVRRYAASQRAGGRPWPLPVPSALGLPPAQFSAAVYALRARLGLLGVLRVATAARSLSADEQRLLRDVPPHHGI